jgi:hypothetical protein
MCPWSHRGPDFQNCYVERLIGSIRRQCLDHVIVIKGNICGAFSTNTSAIIMNREGTCRCRRIHLNHEPFNRIRRKPSFESCRWADSIIDTNSEPVMRSHDDIRHCIRLRALLRCIRNAPRICFCTHPGCHAPAEQSVSFALNDRIGSWRSTSISIRKLTPAAGSVSPITSLL